MVIIDSQDVSNLPDMLNKQVLSSVMVPNEVMEHAGVVGECGVGKSASYGAKNDVSLMKIMPNGIFDMMLSCM